jgi:hypothetical protein
MRNSRNGRSISGRNSNFRNGRSVDYRAERIFRNGRSSAILTFVTATGRCRAERNFRNGWSSAERNLNFRSGPFRNGRFGSF